MKKIQDLKCLNGLTLKLLAMALMLCDHMWATVVPGGQWMTNLGRLAFPIFAFQIAEGYARTHNFKRYLGRMFLFALISELPFNLMTGGGLLFPFHQNVMFTFCLALLMLRLADLGRARGPVWHGLSIVVACGLGWLLGTLAMVDYSGAGVLMVMLFHLTRSLPWGWLVQLGGMIFLNGVLLGGMQLEVSLFGLELTLPQQGLAVLALIPIWLYNGRQGPYNRLVQYACYAFYPLHILVLAVLWLYVL
ncbi:TraX family protein [Pusillibacter faecalis]|uniref:Conjugal transfer protein TraX n=1 Tax=Pusillibacter faecalis TaxID=2714358 RepID=A0A810QFB9_9FIRM|nr:TraX family protein [Pusillibacter faecalis]MCQ5027405.1 conjugal transfer protein TraX [Oscillibacter valericigenes]BCK84556.1 conjugal transfer protein TraX [Pusillibacter faecalis]